MGPPMNLGEGELAPGAIALFSSIDPNESILKQCSPFAFSARS